GEKHPRRTLASTLSTITERNHQRLGNRLIEPIAANTTGGRGRIRRRQRVGGLLNYHYRAAA
ncbi:MAG TPA: hypothetical protein VKP30_22715, partial [Polyangiaceae bacterium]|nr:hypothetical protein [Polyangiaceae bacterium]